MKKTILISFLFAYLGAAEAQNVGIGTNTPAQKLHVVGNARISSLGGVSNRVVSANTNGDLSVIADGTVGQFLSTNGTGTLSWATGGDITGVTAGNGMINGGTAGTVVLDVVAVNGLTTNPDDIRLGGALIQATTITQGAFGMTFNLSGTGDFQIHDAGVSHFEVSDIGRTTFGEDTYWRDISTSGTIIGRFYDSGDDGVFQVYRNGAIQHNINSIGTTVFNEQSGSYDFRIESNGKANMFFVDASTDRIGINMSAPTNVVDMLETTAIGGTDACQSQLNGSTGGALDAVISNTANGYNSFEAIHNGIGSSVFALQTNTSNNGTAVNAQIAANNDRWGLYSPDETLTLGYFVISDKRLKDNIVNINQGIDAIKKLKPVQYNWKKGNAINANTNSLNYGFLAQNILEVAPNLVAQNSIPVLEGKIGPDMDHSKRTYDYHSVNYQGLIPVLTKAIQEQQQIIEKLEHRIEELEKK
jgi:hypothetical protein